MTLGFSRRLLWLALGSALAGPAALAQTPPAPAAPTTQMGPSDTSLDQSADEVVVAGLSALRRIDAGEAGALWDEASAVIKAKIPREEFARTVTEARRGVGAVQRRTWAGIIRVLYDASSTNPPPGLYAEVDFSSLRTDGRTVFEKVSLRHEPSGWHLTGYKPRQQQ